MDNQRKQIIISEIKHWKESKLLPEHYCDFLLALYSRGEELDDSNSKPFVPVLSQQKNKTNKTILYLLLLVVFCTLSLFLFDNGSTLAFSVSVATLLSLLVYARSANAKKSESVPFIYIASAFILLMLSLKLWTVYFEGQTILLIGLLIVNCLLWIIAGRVLNLIYFIISGIAGILLMAFFLITQF